MNEEITIEYEGKKYTAEYIVLDDILTVHLPDGSTRNIELRGLKPESEARRHLINFAKKNK